MDAKVNPGVGDGGQQGPHAAGGRGDRYGCGGGQGHREPLSRRMHLQCLSLCEDLRRDRRGRGLRHQADHGAHRSCGGHPDRKPRLRGDRMPSVIVIKEAGRRCVLDRAHASAGAGGKIPEVVMQKGRHGHPVRADLDAGGRCSAADQTPGSREGASQAVDPRGGVSMTGIDVY